MRSYESAGTFPYKLLRHASELCRKFFPIHISIAPTNRCQLNCSYCTNRDRDKSLEMPLATFQRIITDFKYLGLKALTFTGGEPLLHPNFKEMVYVCVENDIKMGLVTNGIALKNLSKPFLKRLEWIRVSMDAYRKKLPTPPKGLENLAFSYVYTEKDDHRTPNKNLLTLLETTDKGQISHLRIVADIHSAPKLFIPAAIYTERYKNVFIQKRIYESYGRGDLSPCWISLVHPRIEPDGRVDPCCNIQYAFTKENAPRSFLPEFQMGSIDEYTEAVRHQTPYSKNNLCARCFYVRHNELLHKMFEARELKSDEFV